MASSPVTFVVVPGLGDAGPDHWQTLFEAERTDAVRVRQRDWERPTRRAWVKGLEDTVAAVEGQVVFVAHSLGALAVVQWAARTRQASRVAGALLVAPPDLESAQVSLPPRWLLWVSGWAPTPMRKLPFPATVVGSANNPLCSAASVRSFAKSWGANFVDLGAAGHINAASGYGNWRDLGRLLDAMTG